MYHIIYIYIHIYIYITCLFICSDITLKGYIKKNVDSPTLADWRISLISLEVDVM